ncbi:hypothetical protein C1752_01467 [Acaryochloris thomasi RCC1774]|uniref:Uncharacterized protein n=1 Tax=Acaryochloris thomasi RCC1774 TaxID=1764569 RepID=A0A2W1JLL1_9CYAN|nr:hypothetical protein [Acaryochloris thomasi]PZD74086.1 hypothetical protein C1752_01467 [Acaryochloris thomasi RCC1774]
MSHFRCDVTPITTPEHPHILSIGETLTIELSIENQSSEVRRLHLVGSQLPENCYTIHYPDVQVWTGLVVKFNSLELEPGQVGRVQVQIHPPQGAPTQRQQLTLALHSDHLSDAMDVQQTVYLYVEPAHDLLVMLEPKSQAIRGEVGHYQILLKNNGSVHRQLTAQVRSLNRKSLAVYALEPFVINLAPETEIYVALEVRPKKPARFQWGRPRREKFELGLEDHDGLPLPSKLPQGSLTWQLQGSLPRLLLPLVLGATAAAALIGIFWGRQSEVPKIASLQVIATSEATQEEAVRLNWTIKNPKQLQKLVLMRQDSTGQQTLQTLDFSQGIPEKLRQKNAARGFCQLSAESKPKTLTCKNVLAPIPNTQLHRFQLQSFGRRSVTQPADSKLTEAVAIQSNPVPKVVAFFSPNTVYTSDQKSTGVLVAQASNQGKTENSKAGVLLNWEITNAQRIKELQLRSSNGQLRTYDLQSGELPPALAKHCSFGEMLICKQVPTQTQQPGDYVFKLTAFPKGRLAKATAPKATGPIKVNPQPLRIASFRINGQDVTDKYIYDVAKLGPQAKLDLDWKLEGGNEVRAAIFPAPGAVPTVGKTTVQLNPLFQKGTLFLQAVDASGQQIKQAVAIEFRNQPSTAKSLPASPKPPPQSVAVRPPQPAPASPLSRPASPKVSPPAPAAQPVFKPAPVRQRPVATAPPPRPSSELLSEANAIIRGLVLARNDGKIAINGATWRKTQDAIRLLRQGYSRSEAAQRSGVPLWKLDTLVAIGKR